MFVKNKYKLLLNRLAVYFKPQIILNLSNKEVFNNIGAKIDTTTQENTYDFIYMDIECLRKCSPMQYYTYMHNDSMLIVEKNKSKESVALWETIKNDAQVTVTVDLYQIGLVFLRKEQVKQNFIIRF
ncbi:hypothetical protein [Wenyingzhuangia sp. IMCC45574]